MGLVSSGHPDMGGFLYPAQKGGSLGINEVDAASGFGYLLRTHRRKPGKNMSETDIYKNREEDRSGPSAPHPSKRRRRRSASRQLFDDTGNRRRRSKNSGSRRLLHLFRKGKNEKKFWWGLLVAVVVALCLIAIWQFFYLERAAREQSKKDEMYVPLYGLPQTDSAAESE